MLLAEVDRLQEQACALTLPWCVELALLRAERAFDASAELAYDDDLDEAEPVEVLDEHEATDDLDPPPRRLVDSLTAAPSAPRLAPSCVLS